MGNMPKSWYQQQIDRQPNIDVPLDGQNNYVRKSMLLTESLLHTDPSFGTGCDEFGVPRPDNMAEQAGEHAGVWDQTTVSDAGTPEQIRHSKGGGYDPFSGMPGAG